MILIIKGKEYDVVVAKTEEEKEIGLQNVESMDDDEGMLFVYDEPQQLDFWMKDTDIPLDIIFIDENWVVLSTQKGVPHSEELLSSNNAQYVLELNQGSGVLPGMTVEVEDEDELLDASLTPNAMYIIGMDGKPQMELEGGERIFSRPNTKTLVNIAKRAYSSKKDSDYKKLGKKVFEYLTIQDKNDPEYVQTNND